MDINTIIDIAKKYTTFGNDKKELEKILDDQSSDEELKKMAEMELIDLKSQQFMKKNWNYFYYQKMKWQKKCNYWNKSRNRWFRGEFICIRFVQNVWKS